MTSICPGKGGGKSSCSQEGAKSLSAHTTEKLKRLYLGWRQCPFLIPVKIFLPLCQKKAMMENITNAQGFVPWDSRVLNPEICQMHRNKCDSQKPYQIELLDVNDAWGKRLTLLKSYKHTSSNSKKLMILLQNIQTNNLVYIFSSY